MAEKTPDAVIEAIRRLAKEGVLSLPEIADEVGVHKRTVDRYTEDIPADSSKMTAARRVSIEASIKYSNKEIAEYFGIKEENVTPKVRKRYSDIKYSQSLKGVEYQRSYERSPEQLIRKNEKQAVRRAADAEARKALIASYEFEPLSDEAINQIANKKAIDTVHRQKQRSLLYKIAPEPVPESYISYDEYARLRRRGVNVPPILDQVYRGDFSPESTKAMRKTVYDSVHAYLKGGGNPNFIDKELGHIIPMQGVDEAGQRFASGYTNPANTEMQDVFSNRSQGNRVTQDLLKRLGYHTGKSLMNLRGLPWGIGGAATLAASMLPSESAEASTVQGRMGENLTNPNWMFSVATGLPEDFLPGVAQSKEKFSGSSYGEDWDRFKDFWGSVPRRARSLFD